MAWFGGTTRRATYADPVAAKLIALVLPLSLDTFAVAAALGAAGLAPARRLRIAFLFTAFEAGMPLVGLALGAPLGHAIGGAADYVAIGVLIVFGIYTLSSGDRDEEESLARLGRVSGAGALVLGVSISLDELAVGFTFGLLRLPVVLVIVLIAVQAFVAAQLGLRLGARLNERLREGAERLAGAVLAAVGVVLLLEKLLS
jgi:manganese efflux pump family protein